MLIGQTRRRKHHRNEGESDLRDGEIFMKLGSLDPTLTTVQKCKKKMFLSKV